MTSIYYHPKYWQHCYYFPSSPLMDHPPWQPQPSLRKHFLSNPLFGLKICLAISQAHQPFLQSCLNIEGFNDLKFTYLDNMFDLHAIKRGCFTCNPPEPVLDLFSDHDNGIIIDGNGGWSKLNRRNTFSGTRSNDDPPSKVVQNTS